MASALCQPVEGLDVLDVSGVTRSLEDLTVSLCETALNECLCLVDTCW